MQFGARNGEIRLGITLYRSVVHGALDPGNLPIGEDGVQQFPANFHSYILSNSALVVLIHF